MARKTAHPKPLVREAYPFHILFEEKDGIYWLRGHDLERAKQALPIKADPNAVSVGFPKSAMMGHARQLSRTGIKVGVLEGNAVRTVEFHRPKATPAVHGKNIGLAPTLLVGRQEIERLKACLSLKRSTLKDLTLRIMTELSNGHHASLSDFGKIYVYEAWEGAYEVDFELTSMSRRTFEAVALAAHQSRKKLVCQLVPPKSRRLKNSANPCHATKVTNPVTYGQLSLPI